jgi:hypothetical protein
LYSIVMVRLKRAWRISAPVCFVLYAIYHGRERLVNDTSVDILRGIPGC